MEKISFKKQQLTWGTHPLLTALVMSSIESSALEAMSSTGLISPPPIICSAALSGFSEICVQEPADAADCLVAGATSWKLVAFELEDKDGADGALQVVQASWQLLTIQSELDLHSPMLAQKRHHSCWSQQPLARHLKLFSFGGESWAEVSEIARFCIIFFGLFFGFGCINPIFVWAQWSNRKRQG